MAIANGPYYGGGMRIAPDAEPDDGWLDLCVVGDVSRLTAIRELPNLYRGTHVRHPAVSLHRARLVEIEGDGVDSSAPRRRAVRLDPAPRRGPAPRPGGRRRSVLTPNASRARLAPMEAQGIEAGTPLIGARERRIGTVDAVFADYLLVRTASLLPVDLYVPRTETTLEDGRLRVGVGRREAYDRWHRPLKRAPHAAE